MSARYYLAALLFLPPAWAQDVTLEDCVCSSPRSGRVIPSDPGYADAIAACGARAYEQQIDYRVTCTTRVDPVPSLDPLPDPGEPPPDPEPPPPVPGEPLPAFTFAFEGFGAKTRGAHDCPSSTVYRVTSLSNDRDQPGTLMHAAREDCRYIVFDVAGEIDMTGANPGYIAGDSGGPNTWRIVRSWLTIDGRTAPAPGITLTNVDRVSIEYRGPRVPDQSVHDVIVSNIRTVGPYQAGADPNPLVTHDHWELDGTEGRVYNIALEHLTMLYAGQGNVDMYGNVADVTLQRSMSAYSMLGHHLSSAGHVRERISIYANVYAHHNERQFRTRYDTRQVDFVANVIYGWGWYEGGAAGLNPDIGGAAYYSSANIEHNVYHFVGAAPWGRADDALNNAGINGDWYFANNRWPLNETEGDAAATSPIRIPMDGYELPRQDPTAADILAAGTHYKTAAEIELLETIARAVGN